MQESILRFFQSIQSPFLDTLFTYVTMLGEQYFIIIIVAWVYWNYSKKEGFILTFLFLISTLVNSLMKVLFHTQRPFQKLDNFQGKRIFTAEGHSFPSGHTQGASTLFLSLAIIFKNRSYFYWAIFLSLSVAISRLYLGVHWPIDVIGGFVLACIIVFSLYGYMSKIYEKPATFYRFIVIVLTFFYFILLIIIALNAFYIVEPIEIKNFLRLVGVATGAVSGFIFEEKKFPFSVDAHRLKKYLRFIIGMAGTLGLLVGLKYLLPENNFMVIIRYFLVGAWISGIFPILGQKINLFARA
ncbi:MAG: phosphatase PAP2 family protein [Bacteroidales bacterium]|nr:phosphatase PAP2 family protein [Bacteroidales bacterium]